MSSLILFGFKGCGKTTYGKWLAAQLCRPFIDTDELLTQLHGESPRQLSLRLGEKAFRQLEKEVVQSLKGVEDSIIALGGGVVLDPENVALLQSIGRLIYLDAPLEILRERIFEGGIPSFLDPQDPVGSFLKVYAERKPIYESIPAVKIHGF